jgi:hypothetical protein
MCSLCETNENVRRDPDGKWFCVACFDEHARLMAQAQARGAPSLGGVLLPEGVRDQRRIPVSVERVLPNRRTRRRLARGK